MLRQQQRRVREELLALVKRCRHERRSKHACNRRADVVVDCHVVTRVSLSLPFSSSLSFPLLSHILCTSRSLAVCSLVIPVSRAWPLSLLSHLVLVLSIELCILLLSPRGDGQVQSREWCKGRRDRFSSNLPLNPCSLCACMPRSHARM